MTKRLSIEDLPHKLQTRMSLRTLEAGELLFHEGDPVQALYSTTLD
ncbi:MAG: hypothetical protein HC835_17330 [Oscillatoriales cyanobacterium RM2_1_1]|nr:hypothetical protein [Oscillatoriales cyanobacterium SM2_3_0]NJO47231.1 hypothetical protein [Oscillatoriales cyanobacterium RM2_1_1]